MLSCINVLKLAYYSVLCPLHTPLQFIVTRSFIGNAYKHCSTSLAFPFLNSQIHKSVFHWIISHSLQLYVFIISLVTLSLASSIMFYFYVITGFRTEFPQFSNDLLSFPSTHVITSITLGTIQSTTSGMSQGLVHTVRHLWLFHLCCHFYSKMYFIGIISYNLQRYVFRASISLVILLLLSSTLFNFHMLTMSWLKWYKFKNNCSSSCSTRIVVSIVWQS